MEILTFKTSGDWTVEEWNTCLASISKIYNVFLAIEIIKVYEKGIPDSFASNKLSITKVLNNLSDYADESAKLRIHKIKMASPGSFSLEGSGEPIEATSKFIIKILELLNITTRTKKITDKILIEKLEEMKLKNERYKEETERIRLENTEKIISNELIEGQIIINAVIELLINNNENRKGNKKSLKIDDDGDDQIDKETITTEFYEGIINGILKLIRNGKLVDLQKSLNLITK